MNAQSTGFCPCCGYNLVKDIPIVINDFSMLGESSPFCWRGEPVRIPVSARLICWTLMKAYPQPVRRDVILLRIGSEAETNVIDVYLSRARTVLRAIGAPIPFESIRGRKDEHACALVWVPR